VHILERSIYLSICALLGGALGCGETKKAKVEEETTTPEKVTRPVAVEVPWDTSARDDVNIPVLKVMVISNGAEGVAVPYLYGYPIFAEGDSANAILKLRQDNWTGAEPEQFEDEAGVIHYKENIIELGCVFEGIKETETRFIPLSLLCQLPAPKKYGGAKRSAIGELKAGAKAAEVVQEPSIRSAFLGGWHLTSDDFDSGNGFGYFNTAHGLLALGFTGGRLDRVAYYFSPSVKRWQDATLWIKP
jgi:hypothetical protein